MFINIISKHVMTYIRNFGSILDSSLALTVQKSYRCDFQNMSISVATATDCHNVEPTAFNWVSLFNCDHPTQIRFAHSSQSDVKKNVNQSKSFPCLKPSHGFWLHLENPDSLPWPTRPFWSGSSTLVCFHLQPLSHPTHHAAATWALRSEHRALVQGGLLCPPDRNQLPSLCLCHSVQNVSPADGILWTCVLTNSLWLPRSETWLSFMLSPPLGTAVYSLPTISPSPLGSFVQMRKSRPSSTLLPSAGKFVL